MADDAAKQAALAKFQELTQADITIASQYLDRCSWSTEDAVVSFFEDEYERERGNAHEPVSDEYTGPRTLDGRPAPLPENSGPSTPARPSSSTPSSSMAKTKPKRKTGLATFASLNADDDDDDSSDDERRRNLFAGGEKSGLAIQDPPRDSNRDGNSDLRDEARNIMRQLMEAARNHTREEDHAASQAQTSRFTGNAYTLGGEGTESRMIPGAPSRSSAPSTSEEVQQSEIHTWDDGFSINAGPLYPFSDPNNVNMLRMIQRGQAPLSLFNVRPNQPLRLCLVKHQEKWRQLPRPREAFSGTGQRLGSHVPGASDSTSSAAVAPATAPTPAAPASSAALQVSTEYDASQPSVAVRVQLPSGARLPARFNLTQTVGDIYSFVSRSDPTVASRAFVITTTFPSKDHTDKAAVLGETAEFKKGGVAIVKWL
ncbi:hypothetical protein TD95_003675 [Thielaviopsis punctulata]|uniref:UBX domain-containing protein n=1 Tax=Thielaviopsis punctulata TaxID=72032 RepID=A0A0F4Z8W3_9PEZI|nr:hypothetical protein TD95_003675 [Thielaviopsis punctulata]